VRRLTYAELHAECSVLPMRQRWHQQGDRVAVYMGMTRSLPLPCWRARGSARFIRHLRWLAATPSPTVNDQAVSPFSPGLELRPGNEIQLKRTVDEA